MKGRRPDRDQRCWACGHLVKVTVRMVIPTVAGRSIKNVCTGCAVEADRGHVLEAWVARR